MSGMDMGIAVYPMFRPHKTVAAGALVIAVLAITQKLLPAKTTVDVAPMVAIAGFGVLIFLAPSAVPRLTPSK